MRPIDLVLSRLEGVRKTADGWQALCPAHEDHNPSLSVSEGSDGRVLLYCHRGCAIGDILAALRLDPSDLFPKGFGNESEQRTAKAGEENRDWSQIAERYRSALTRELLSRLAEELHVSPQSLSSLGLGWDGSAFTVPERDGDGRAIGIGKRTRDGKKLAERGGHRGLTIPDNLDELWGTVPVVEGMSDVAAFVTLQLTAVGRPSNASGAEHLAKLLQGRDILILGERDEKPDGSWPGREGAVGIAKKLAASWRHPVRWTLPPEQHKDIRAWLAAQVAEGLDVDDVDACKEAGACLLRMLEEDSLEERPAFSVRVVNDKYGRVLAVLCCGDAKEPGGTDILHSGRLRPGEQEDADAWVLDAFVGAKKVLGWIDDSDGERITSALREALDAHIALLVSDSDEGTHGCEKAADALVRITLEKYRLGLSDTGEPFAVERCGPNIALSLRGSAGALRQRLAREYRRAFDTTPSGSALTDALTVLAGEAQDCEAEKVHLRMARSGKAIVIDVGDAVGRAILVTPDGWQVLQRSPVLFRRTALTRAFPMPQAGGNINELWTHLRVAPADRALILGWLIHGYIPGEPHAIPLLGGQQGSAKTTTAERLVSLIDPSGAPTRTAPRDTRQHAITVSGSWAVAIDNISSIPDWLSDAWCRAATGDGWVDRSLYTDDELAVLQFQRVILLTSIDPGALRGDLGDRLVLVDLERIAPDERLPKSKLDAAWEQAMPRILGVLLDLLCRVLATLPSVEPDSLPRMADYARVLAALDKVIGTSGLDHYAAQTQRVAEDVVEGDQVATAVSGFVRERGFWVGTAGELLTQISPEKPPRGWPRTPRGLGSRLRRVAPALRELGIDVVPPDPKDKRRQWSLRILGDDDPPEGRSGEGDSTEPDQGLDWTARTAQPPRTGPEGSVDADSARAVQRAEPLNRPADRPTASAPSDPEKADLGRLGCSGGRVRPADVPVETPSGDIASGRKDARQRTGGRHG